MIILFWTAVACAIAWVLLATLIGIGFDTWGERLITPAAIVGVAGIVTGLLFVITFGLHTLGVTP